MKYVVVILVSTLCLFVIIGYFTIRSKMPEEAIRFTKEEMKTLERKANNGDGDACYCIYINYRYHNHNKAQYWLRKAAQYGNADAEYGLFTTTRSVSLLEKAAEKGNSWAQLSLGDYYRNQHKSTEAHYWYLRSAMQGNEAAIVYLSNFLMEIKNDKDHLVEAYIWTIIGIYLSPNKECMYVTKLKTQQKAIFEKTIKLGYVIDVKRAEQESIRKRDSFKVERMGTEDRCGEILR
jgi:TPR repeat protein